MPDFFITATDTDAGKTFVSANLLNAAKRQNLKCFGYKPVASGCEMIEQELRNEDVLSLQAAGSVELPYHAINLYSFRPAIAPHIAASQAGAQIDLDKIVAQYTRLKSQHQPDLSIVEGVGGWYVPLASKSSSPSSTVPPGIPELAEKLRLPIIVVVKIKLGCINHAVLTLEAIKLRGLTIKGWIANAVDDDEVTRANIAAITERTEIPLLAEIPVLSASFERLEEERKNAIFGQLLHHCL